jgi:hypothetical protein
MSLVRNYTVLHLNPKYQLLVTQPPSVVIKRGKEGVLSAASTYFKNLEQNINDWIFAIYVSGGTQYGIPEPTFYLAETPEDAAEWFTALLKSDHSNRLLMDQVRIWIPPQPFDTLLNWKFVPQQLLETIW